MTRSLRLLFLVLVLAGALPCTTAPVPPGVSTDSPPEGFTNLFNGHDLTGWKDDGSGHWGAENGLLVYDGGGWQPHPDTVWERNLQTEKEYGNFILLIDWKIEKWNFSMAASAHTGWPTTDLLLTDDGLVVPGPRNAQRHGTFGSLDVRLSRRFDVRRGSLLAFVEISNVLNRQNECCLDWDFVDDPQGDDALERGLDYWMPILPAIGVLWEF